MESRNNKSDKDNKSSLDQYGEVAWEGFVPPPSATSEHRKNELPSIPKEGTYKSHPNELYSYEIESSKKRKRSAKEELKKDKVTLTFSTTPETARQCPGK